MNKDIADMRLNYSRSFLEEKDIAQNPINQFRKWFNEATDSQIVEPNAMTIATVNAKGVPSARIVLLKEIDKEGFILYTNYESAKASDIAANPNVSLVFLWKELERQVRITGVAEKVSAERSLNYFHKRPKGSQIGAWTSPQSQVINDRSILEKRKIEIEEQYKNADELPLPDFWGGYIIRPTNIEFWQGRPNRLHDRLRYVLNDGLWEVDRLAP